MSLLIGSNVDLQHACAHACGLNIDAKYIIYISENKTNSEQMLT
jgi:hypothetical protein